MARGNATSVQQRLAGRSRRGEVVEGCTGGAAGRSKGLICRRVTWMGYTGGKSGRRPARHLPVEASGPGNARPAHWRLAARFRGGEIDPGRTCAVWLQVGVPELSSGHIGEIREVSRVGAQGVTSKSKLLAREMPRVCGGGLRVDSEAAKSLKVAPAQSGSKSTRRSSPRDL